MPIDLRCAGDLPVEGPVLDEEAAQEREKLTEFVLAEYRKTGTLCSAHVCEAVKDFENYARGHLKKD